MFPNNRPSLDPSGFQETFNVLLLLQKVALVQKTLYITKAQLKKTNVELESEPSTLRTQRSKADMLTAINEVRLFINLTAAQQGLGSAKSQADWMHNLIAKWTRALTCRIS